MTVSEASFTSQNARKHRHHTRQYCTMDSACMSEVIYMHLWHPETENLHDIFIVTFSTRKSLPL